jgi:hypothetical protein
MRMFSVGAPQAVKRKVQEGERGCYETPRRRAVPTTLVWVASKLQEETGALNILHSGTVQRPVHEVGNLSEGRA